MSDYDVPIRLLSKYNEDNGTLANGETDRRILKGEVNVIYFVEIINDDGSDSLEVNFDATDRPAITVAAGETRTLNYPAKEIFLTNTAAGSTTAYRVLMMGE